MKKFNPEVIGCYNLFPMVSRERNLFGPSRPLKVRFRGVEVSGTSGKSCAKLLIGRLGLSKDSLCDLEQSIATSARWVSLEGFGAYWVISDTFRPRTVLSPLKRGIVLDQAEKLKLESPLWENVEFHSNIVLD